MQKKQVLTLPSDLLDILKKVADKEIISDLTIKLTPGNNKGDGYVGEILFFTIKDKEEQNEKHIVVKKAITSQRARDNMPIRLLFLNEIHYYRVIHPQLVEFQKNFEIKPLEMPKHLASSTEDMSEMVVLENLKFANFEPFDKRSIFRKMEAELICQTYGRLHAISFAYRDKYPDKFDKFSISFNIWNEFFKTPTYVVGCSGVCKLAEKCLDKDSENHIIKEFQKYIVDTYEVFRKSSQYLGPYAVFIHGDSWRNNLMFKYNESRQPIDMRIVDWQMAGIGHPVCDLSYCFYSNPNKNILDEFDHYLKIYYETLVANIKKFGCNTDKLFSFTVLKEQWKEYCKFGILMGLLVLKINLTYDDEISDFQDIIDSSSEADEKTNVFIKGDFDKKTFLQRARDLILHAYNMGAL